MARQAHKLTPTTVKAAKRPGNYPDGAGLFLQVSVGRDAAPRRSWVVRYTLAGKRREMGLGPAAEVDLDTARELARDVRKAARANRDPINERRDRKTTALAAAARATAAAAQAEARNAKPGFMTFKDCAEAYMAAHEAGWRNDKHAAQWRSTLKTYAYPVLGAQPVAEVDQAAVMAVLDPIWTAKTETASRVRGRIETVLDYAKARLYRSGENPARWKGNLEYALPARAKVAPVQHHRAVPVADMPDAFASIASRTGSGADCLRFLILTAARFGEAAGATWGEIDVQGGVWTVPAKRMKGGRLHRVPLSTAALGVLKARFATAGAAEPDKLIFESDMRRGRTISQATLGEVLRRAGRTETVHGFRSTFRDWAAERTNFPREVAEAALAHAVGDKVEAAYRRGDLFEKRRKLMDAWGSYCVSTARKHST
ncbi:MAG: tyrosine-type recombinase/integrase [Hyphomonadaceae bacterium]|nr:tyrosine-type recombinase/integrase [Hyphomonadaceae bacterium]